MISFVHSMSPAHLPTYLLTYTHLNLPTPTDTYLTPTYAYLHLPTPTHPPAHLPTYYLTPLTYYRFPITYYVLHITDYAPG